jgi:hypothetical protein
VVDAFQPDDRSRNAWCASRADCSDAYFLRLDAGKSAVLGSSFLGGRSHDFGAGIALHGDDAWLVGTTWSTDFPVTSGSPQAAAPGGDCGFYRDSLEFDPCTDAFVSRVGMAKPPPVPSPSPSPTASPSPAATATATATPAPTATPIPPTPIPPTPTTAPTSTPQPSFAVTGEFGRVYEGNATVRAGLGLPSADAAPVSAATLQFEHGLMYWRGDTRTIYVLFADQPGVWYSFADAWTEGSPAGGGAGPQAGQYIPKRGFGKVWRERAEVQQRLGYAVTPEEFGYTGPLQQFENGVMLSLQSQGQGGQGRWVYALYADGTYERYPAEVR